MKPVVFTIPGLNFDIPGYGFCLMAAFLISIWWATRRAEKSGANPEVILNVGFLALIGGVVGCRLMYVIHYWDQFAGRGSTIDVIWAIIDIRRGGLEFYGGFILTILMTIFWLRYVEKVSLRWYFDIMAPSAALGLAIGRIGCFLNGCCFGGPCELPWAVEFPYGSPPAITQWHNGNPNAGLPQELLYTHAPGITTPISRESLAYTKAEVETAIARQLELKPQLDAAQQELASADPGSKSAAEAKVNKLTRAHLIASGTARDLRDNMTRYEKTHEEMHALAAEYGSPPLHPTQLYSTVTAGLIAFLLNAVYWRRSHDGQVIFTLLAIEPISRWMLEVIRTDNPIDTLGVFTISQGLAVTMTVIGILGLLWIRTQPPRSKLAWLWEEDEEDSDDAAPAATA